MAFSLVVVVFRIIECNGRDWVDFGTEQSKQVDFALGLRIGHVDDEFVAFGTTNVGKTDACVAGGALNDGAARLELAALFGVLHYIEGGAVFDRAAGVLEFSFSEDFAARLAGEVIEADEGRVANGGDQAVGGDTLGRGDVVRFGVHRFNCRRGNG